MNLLRDEPPVACAGAGACKTTVFKDNDFADPGFGYRFTIRNDCPAHWAYEEMHNVTGSRLAWLIDVREPGWGLAAMLLDRAQKEHEQTMLRISDQAKKQKGQITFEVPGPMTTIWTEYAAARAQQKGLKIPSATASSVV